MRRHDIAPELRRIVRWIPRPPFGSREGRWLIRAAIRLVPETRTDGVRLTSCSDVSPSLRLHQPEVQSSSGALLWIHGGGFMIGNARIDDRQCGEFARDLGMVVVAAGYRLAPEHPFPAALDDCLAAWRWLQASATTLGFDPAKVIIGGQSAGGALAASLVQRIHDLGGVQPCGQLLFCPMLDDRTATRRDLDRPGHVLWDNATNQVGWRCYLGVEPGSDSIPEYAVPARRADVSKAPTTWIGVGDLDLFAEEDQAYAARLRDAGVEVELDLVAGAPHAFESWAPKTSIAVEYMSLATAWLRQLVGQFDANQP